VRILMQKCSTSRRPSADHSAVAPEAELDGWFVLNARDARWFDKPGQRHSAL
jgi:hypothetical protein